MPSELLDRLFRRKCEVETGGETWESAPAESSADATHLTGLAFGAPVATEWLRRLEDTSEEDELAEALSEALAERGELPGHAPTAPSSEDTERLRRLAEALAQMREEFSKERERLGDEKEELARRQAELDSQAKALEEERLALRKQEEAYRDYPVPDWLSRKTTLKGTINIGVVGNAGVGKSLLINRLRRIRPHADGWAEVGVNETTMEPAMYVFRNCSDVRLWDLPGAGTEAFPSQTYIRSMGLRHFDKVIIVTAGRFTSTEVALRNELVDYKVPFFMVRTKVDIDAYNNLQDNNMTEQATVAQIAEDLRKTHGVEKPYLVSLRDQQAYDMPKLMGELFAGQGRTLDPFAPSFCPSAPAWNEPWAMPVALSPAVGGLQGRWYDSYGAVYLIQGLEVHVTLREGQAAIVHLSEGASGTVWWTLRWYVDAPAVSKALFSRELRWTPKNRQDRQLIWWWSD